MTTIAATRNTTSDMAALGRRFVINLSVGFASKTAQIGVSLFLVAYVLRHLGPERYGLVVVAVTLVAFLGLVQAGASAGLGRQLNIALSRGEWDRFNQYYSAGTLLSIGVAVTIGIGVGLLLTAFWSWTHIPAEFRQEGQWVLAAIGAASICSSLVLPSLACFQAAQRIDVPEKIILVGILLRGLAVVVLFETFGASLKLYAAILLLEQAAVTAGTFLARRRVIPEAECALREITPGCVREVAGFNFLNLIANLNYVAFMQVPALVLQRFEGLAIAGFYGIGLQVNNLVRGLLNPVLGALSPAAISLHSSGKADQLSQLFVLTTKCFTAAAALLWVFLYFLGEPLLALWLKRDVTPLTQALPWLIAASAAGVAAMPASIFSIALGRLRLPAISGLVLALVMTGFIVTLSKNNWQPGLIRTGMLLAAFFSLYQLIRVVEVAAALKVKLVSLCEIGLRAGLPAVLGGVVLFAAARWMPPGSFIEILCVSAVALAAAGAAANWNLLSPVERKLITRVVFPSRFNSVVAI